MPQVSCGILSLGTGAACNTCNVCRARKEGRRPVRRLFPECSWELVKAGARWGSGRKVRGLMARIESSKTD